jgi:hypothetical protein
MFTIYFCYNTIFTNIYITSHNGFSSHTTRVYFFLVFVFLHTFIQSYNAIVGSLLEKIMMPNLEGPPCDRGVPGQDSNAGLLQ